MNLALILAIFEQVLRYGPEVVIEIAELFKGSEDPTPEQIRALKITKDPEEYFK